MASPIDLSVLIPVRATEPEHLVWLREAVDSIWEQNYPVKEVMICDDHSPLPVDGFGDCQVWRLDKHGGVCEARNFLGANCKTKYLLFLDADDKLYEGALHKMAARADPKKAIYGNLMIFGNGYAQRYHNLKEFDEVEMLRHPIMPVTSLHTKDAFNEIGGFDSQFEGGLEEWDYNIRLMLECVCGEQLHEPVLWYRRHKGQRSAGRSWLMEQTWKIRDKYQKLEGMTMGCCGGRRRPRANNPGNPHGNLTPAELASGEMVLIQYTGRRLGGVTIRGKATNTSYRFSASQREKYVWPKDAPGLLELPDYRLVRQRPSVPARPPDARLLEQEARESQGRGRPSPDQDLTAIKGLGKARVAKLAEVGITRYEHLAAASAETVAGAAGVGPKRAADWIGEARLLT